MIPQRCHVVGLDVALMDGCRVERALDHDAGLAEAGPDIAQSPPEVLGHVGRAGRLLSELLGEQVVVQQRCPIGHRFRGRHGRRQRFIVHFDSARSLQCDVSVPRSHRDDGVALIEGLALGEDIAVDVSQTGHALAHIDLLVLGRGQVVRRDDRMDPVHGLGLGSVDGADNGVSVRAAQDCSVERVRQRQVGPVDGSPSDLIRSVVAHGARADNVEVTRGENHVGFVILGTAGSIAPGSRGHAFGLRFGGRCRAHAAVSCRILAAD